MTLILVLAAGAAFADKLTLKDGRQLDGQVNEVGDKVVIVNADGVQTFTRAEVEGIEYDLLKRVDPAVRETFLIVQAAARRKETIDEAIALWNKYIADHPGGALVPVAQEEIDKLKKAAADGLVPWAGKLMKPEERESARHEAFERLDAGIANYERGKYAEARRDLAAAELAWPDHPTANFYLGQTLRKLLQPVDAAKRFVRVTAALPDHVPALNNAACLCARLTDYRSATKLLAQALRRDPDDETLVNNSWEVLHALEADKQGPVLRLDFFKVNKDDLKVLQEACAEQQRRMNAQDKHRWGSAWISKRELDAHLAEQATIDGRLKEIASRAAQVKRQVDALNEQIDLTARMREEALRMGNTTLAWQLQRKGLDLQVQRDGLQKDMAILTQEARDLQRRRPQPTWTGEMLALDVERPLDKLSGGPEADEAVRRAVLSGKAALVAQDGTFLGLVSIDRHDPKSISDPLGPHGSPYSKVSVLDPTSDYGRRQSDLSAQDPSAAKPPQIVLDDKPVCYLTANATVKPAISLETLAAILRTPK